MMKINLRNGGNKERRKKGINMDNGKNEDRSENKSYEYIYYVISTVQIK